MPEDVELTELILLSDEPTVDHNADGLDMLAYAKVIARAAIGTRGPFVIGVHGKWGEGKTSVLRQARSLIAETDGEVITVWFNAWQYDHELYPLVPLALAIAGEVDRAIPDGEKYGKAGRWITLREIGAALRAVATGLTLRTPVFEISGKEVISEIDRAGAAEVGTSLASSVYQRAYDLLMQASAVGVDEEGDARRPPIVVFIDDLDRCTPERALRLLQSVRLVLSQPGFLFVLALDRDPVTHHLAREYERLKIGKPDECARSYLDKMIQLPLWIPPHSARFEGFIKKVLDREEMVAHPEVREAVAELAEVLCVGTEANPRAVVRLVNSAIADLSLWEAKGKSVDSTWLGFCVISRVLRDRLGDAEYRTLVDAEDLCTQLTEAATTGQALEEWLRRMQGVGKEELTQSEQAVRRVLERIVHSDPIRALLGTGIGRRWLESGNERREIQSYLSHEPAGETGLKSPGEMAIEEALRGAFRLGPDREIGSEYRRRARSLDLSKEAVTNEDLSLLRDMSGLTRLSLSDSLVTDSGLEHLSNLLAISHLDLSGLEIEGHGLPSLERMEGLVSLNLSDTLLTDPTLAQVSQLKSLEDLYLDGCRIDGTGLRYLRGLRNLERLDLAWTTITDDSLSNLRVLVRLRELSLAHTSVTRQCLAHVMLLPALRVLRLFGTSATDDWINELSGLPALTRLDLSETAVTPEGRRRLAALKPDLHVLF